MEVRLFPAISKSVVERKRIESIPASINRIARTSCGMRREKLRVINYLVVVRNIPYDTSFSSNKSRCGYRMGGSLASRPFSLFLLHKCAYWHTPSDAQASTDRKSTRLNSSHSQISYAVFCL